MNVRTREQVREKLDGNGRGGKIRGKMMVFGYGLKRFIADRAADFSIGGATMS
jgi:hypothetical protein